MLENRRKAEICNNVLFLTQHCTLYRSILYCTVVCTALLCTSCPIHLQPDLLQHGKRDFSKVARERKGRASLFMFSVSPTLKVKTNDNRKDVQRYTSFISIYDIYPCVDWIPLKCYLYFSSICLILAERVCAQFVIMLGEE